MIMINLKVSLLYNFKWEYEKESGEEVVIDNNNKKKRNRNNNGIYV